MDTLSLSNLSNRLATVANQTGITTAEASDAFHRFSAMEFIYGEIFDFSGLKTVTADLELPAEHRKRCAYCGVLSEKDYGTCDHCGAPL